MKNQRFLSALAATVMAVSLFTCTALAANEPADTAASEPTQQTEVVTADTDTGSEKGALSTPALHFAERAFSLRFQEQEFRFSSSQR